MRPDPSRFTNSGGAPRRPYCRYGCGGPNAWHTLATANPHNHTWERCDAITSEPERAAPRRDVPRQTARILVVDDIEDNRDLLVRRLRREGYHDTQVAADGEQALRLIDTQAFDLVLLDIMMPICNGYEVLERLRAANRLHELPVIVISAHTELDSAVRCIELGAVDYLPKPFNPTLLRARVNATIEQKRLRDAVRAHLTRIEAELDTARKLQAGMVPTSIPGADGRTTGRDPRDDAPRARGRRRPL